MTSKYSKQHYEDIAQLLVGIHKLIMPPAMFTRSEIIGLLTREFAALFINDNPRFDRKKFLEDVEGKVEE